MKIIFNKSIQDGKLDYHTGRIIIHNKFGIKSNGPSMDHNDLIASFSRKFRFDKSSVMSNGFRFYWKPVSKDTIIVCPVRKIDENFVDYNQIEFELIVNSLF